MMGEMGRTPQINDQAGRDHWSMAQSVLFAGGGVKPGQVIGATDKHCVYPDDRPRGVEDVICTIFHQMGIDTDKTYYTPLGRPVPIVNGGRGDSGSSSRPMLCVAHSLHRPFSARLPRRTCARRSAMSIRRAAKAGTTIEVVLGTYDWTPDMQVFSHDPRIKIEITGPAGEPILTPPPYWFGAKAGQAQPPLRARSAGTDHDCRRRAARADPLAGGQRERRHECWHVRRRRRHGNRRAGVSRPGRLELPSLPADDQRPREQDHGNRRVSLYRPGRRARHLPARRSARPAVPWRAASLRWRRQARGRCGRYDRLPARASLFARQAGATYTARVHDVEFGGDRGYVYRLSIARGPKVVATLPPVVQRGFAGNVELIGWGVASGQAATRIGDAAGECSRRCGRRVVRFGFDTPTGRASRLLTLGERPTRWSRRRLTSPRGR